MMKDRRAGLVFISSARLLYEDDTEEFMHQVVSIFWDSQGVIMMDYLEEGLAIRTKS